VLAQVACNVQTPSRPSLGGNSAKPVQINMRDEDFDEGFGGGEQQGGLRQTAAGGCLCSVLLHCLW
jgi:hypothetical protein